jgi:aspartyl-tRNA(Asn)/glutamyl-tRNA(Gln) amidotransferase subunit C
MDRATVEYVARLSRVDLSEAEIELFSSQLSDILAYIAKLNELDTTGVAPLAQAVEVPNAFRDDAPRPSLSPSEALANAPERVGDFYKVPAVLE